METSQKLKIELSYDPATLILGIFPKTKTLIQKDTHLYVHGSILYNSPDM